jgi:hypothetical protein
MLEIGNEDNTLIEILPVSAKDALQHRSVDPEIKEYLGAMPHFRMLPVEDLEELAAHITPCIFTKGERLAIQGKTRLSFIYVI